MAEDLLTINSITKWFGDPAMPNLVLDHIQLSIKEGDFVTMLGRSGCGKSTLLRIIAGLIQPNEGEVLYQGKKFTDESPRLAMVFQSHALFPWLTVLENVELGLGSMDLTPNTMRRKALEAIDLIGLDGYESAYPKELSGGMSQRVGFARALVVDPDVLLLDEPFSALDVLTADTIRNDLLELWVEKRIPTKAIIMVSHNVNEAVTLSNRLIVLGHDPARIIMDTNVPLIYPRDDTSQHFQAIVDSVYTALMTPAESSATGAKGEKVVVKPAIGLDYLLPQASINQFRGLMDVLYEPPYNGKADIFALAESENLTIKESLPLFEAIELLGFAKSTDGDIALTDSGKALCRADFLEIKKMFAYQLLRHVPLAKHIYSQLQDDPRKRLSKKEFLKNMERFMPEEDAKANLSIIINWGRYAELFAYDDHNEVLSLENPTAEETAPEATG